MRDAKAVLDWYEKHRNCRYCLSDLTKNKSVKTCDNCGAEYPKMPKKLYWDLCSDASTFNGLIDPRTYSCVFRGLKILV